MGATHIIDRISRLCGSRQLSWLLLINAAAALCLWVSMLILHVCGVNMDVLHSLFALPSGALSFAMHPWTLVTYMFVHFSPLHLLFNMLWLFWFGRMLADTERDRTITTIFIVGGITGGVAYVAASALSGYGPGSYLAGSSAAVLCLMCATAVRMPDRRIGLFLIGEVKLKWVAAVCVALTLLGGASAIPAQCAHVAGIVAGLASRRIAQAFKAAAGRPATRVHPASSASKTSKKVSASNIRNMRRAMPSQSELNERLDIILDKIRLSGFDSLSEREKSELDYLSTVIKR